jgi:hypothetical protein
VLQPVPAFSDCKVTANGFGAFRKRRHTSPYVAIRRYDDGLNIAAAHPKSTGFEFFRRKNLEN